MILRHSYTRSRATAHAALRYYHLRPRGDGEPPRQFFGPAGTLTRGEACRLLDQHQPAAGRYLAHRLMLSPSDTECPDDLRAMTYQAMRGLAHAHDQHLAWVAVEHCNTDQPHVHILLAGGDLAGGRGEVRLGPVDHARLKAEAADYCRLEARLRRDWDRALAHAASAEERTAAER
ncbi:MAG TPA: hypothetical protein VFU72_12235, partial [Nitrolancea sp.]|nr:hypothetical protein [Nitrolancea sp.]